MILTKETRSMVQIHDTLKFDNDSYKICDMWASGKGISVTIINTTSGSKIYRYPLSQLYGAEIIKRPQDKFTAEAFYTGGGIWLAAKYISDVTYIVIDSDDPLCLTYYDHREEDTDNSFPCQNPFRTVGIEEMNSADLVHWKELAAELHKKAY